MTKQERLSKEKLQAELATAPEKMTLRDEAMWNEYQSNNTEPYGLGVIQYAETWARLMEARMSRGETLEACAMQTSNLVSDAMFVTGFQYGAAAATLVDVWIHGEAFRRWFNLKTQIGHEGEEANAEGGILNPAFLRTRAKKS